MHRAGTDYESPMLEGPIKHCDLGRRRVPFYFFIFYLHTVQWTATTCATPAASYALRFGKGLTKRVYSVVVVDDRHPHFLVFFFSSTRRPNNRPNQHLERTNGARAPCRTTTTMPIGQAGSAWGAGKSDPSRVFWMIWIVHAVQWPLYADEIRRRRDGPKSASQFHLLHEGPTSEQRSRRRWWMQGATSDRGSGRSRCGCRGRRSVSQCCRSWWKATPAGRCR